MTKLQEYLAISLMWYQKAEKWKELAEIEKNPTQKREYLTMSIQAARKGEQFELKANGELKTLQALSN